MPHRRLVDIHPFNDGHGRTARLLMNLVLIRGGYPPIAVRPEDRVAYIRALQLTEAGEGSDSFDRLLYERLDATSDEYLSVATSAACRAFCDSRGFEQPGWRGSCALPTCAGRARVGGGQLRAAAAGLPG